jgi:hypothetical protein
VTYDACSSASQPSSLDLELVMNGCCKGVPDRSKVVSAQKDRDRWWQDIQDIYSIL